MAFSCLKKCICLIFVIILLCFFGCSGAYDDDGNALVVAANFPAYDFATHVCGNSAKVSMLLPAGSESHSYEPTAQDIIKIQNCKLFIYTGGESDAWVDKILNSLDKNIKTLKMVDCVPLLPVQHEHNDGHEHNHDDIEYDEHVWTSPINAIKIVNKIKETLCTIDSNNSLDYEKNANSYIDKISSLDKDFRDFFETVDNKTLIFGDRFPLIYFTKEYGLEHASAFPGCADHSEPSASTIAELIKKIDSENISTVYYIEFSNHNIADTLANETGAKTALFYSCHNVSKEQLDDGVSYVSLMQENLSTLMKNME